MNIAFSRFVIFIFVLIYATPTEASGACVDSVRLTIQPVQCFGLRNGLIRIDTVFGGERPFYFSIDGQTFSTRPEFESLWAGDYLIYVRDASGCVWETSVYVPEPEELKVKLTASDTVIEAGMNVKIIAQVSPDNVTLKQVDWRPPALFPFQNERSQIASPAETTIIAVEVSDYQNCVARDQLTIHVEKTSLYFPNIFKPGSNQDAYFTAYGGEGVARIVQLQVYSRGGGLVFERNDFQPNDPLKGWNGRWRDKYVQAGVYPWLAIVEYLDGTKTRLQGGVTVVN